MDDSTLYDEKRGIRPPMRFLLLLCLTVSPAYSWWEYRDPREVLIGLGLGIGMALFILLIVFSPAGGNQHRALRVDDRGFWVGPKLLPAHEIGRVERLTGKETAKIYGTWRAKGLKLNHLRSTINWGASDDPCILIEQTNPHVRHPAWVITTRHPDRLITALHTVRDRARGTSDVDP